MTKVERLTWCILAVKESFHQDNKGAKPEMKEKITAILSEVGPDLLEPPHVVPVLMELFAGDRQQALTQQEQLLAHLVACHYCQTAAKFLIGVAQGVDRENNESEEDAHDLLKSFADIDRKIEAHRYEMLAVYAETIVAKGRDEAAALFPDLAAHLLICSDCRLIIEETVAFIKAEDTG